MKKLICLLAVMGMLAAVGCSQQGPEDAAKEFMTQQIAKHKGFDLDMSALSYRVVEQGDDSVKVAVSGNIAVKGEIPLIKKGGKWVVGEKPAAPAGHSVPPATTAPAAKKAPAQAHP